MILIKTNDYLKYSNKHFTICAKIMNRWFIYFISNFLNLNRYYCLIPKLLEKVITNVTLRYLANRLLYKIDR